MSRFSSSGCTAHSYISIRIPDGQEQQWICLENVFEYTVVFKYSELLI